MTSESNENSSERRRFFRIEDRVGVEIKTLDSLESPIDDLFDTDFLSPLFQELRRLDHDVRHQLNLLFERDRQVSNLVKALNHKLDTMARIMAFQQNPLQPDQWLDVTLSEGGMAFPDPRGNWQPGQLLAIRLTLLPDLARPLVKARVLERSEEECPTPLAHLTFLALDDADRQQIARHVLRRQARERQEQRASDPE